MHIPWFVWVHPLPPCYPFCMPCDILQHLNPSARGLHTCSVNGHQGGSQEGGGRCATREQAKRASRQQRGRRQLKCRHLGHVLVAWQQWWAAQTAIQRLLRLLAGTASRARHSGGAPRQPLWHPIRPGVCAASPPARHSSQGQRLISLTACRGCGSGQPKLVRVRATGLTACRGCASGWRSCSSCCCCAPCCGCCCRCCCRS